MAFVYKYNVSKNGRMILRDATAKKIFCQLGVKEASRYAKSKMATKDGYEIQYTDETLLKIEQDESRSELEKQFSAVSKKKFTYEMFCEWIAMNRRYGKVAG